MIPGALTRAECVCAEELDQATGRMLSEMEMKHFTQLDVDMSQSLTWSEFRASRLFNSGFTGLDSRGRIQPKDSADLFAKADLDGDGTLVRQEFNFLTNNNQFKEI
jgi:hypothetical protein